MERKDELIATFAEQYMEKIFYFCLKKTGNEYEAEDLSQEIALCVLSELYRGVVPESFSGYVWQIARNRYARWAEKKHKRLDMVVGSDIGEFEIADGETTAEELIHAEDMAALRRELAFIASDYRELILAYYIEDKSVKEIAKRLSVPEGTVKTRLFRARNLLKEGMNMAREFGKRSYKPEDIHYTMTVLGQN